jgi:hypothetical protein
MIATGSVRVLTSASRLRVEHSAGSVAVGGRLHGQRAFGLQRLDELRGIRGLVFVDDRHAHLARRRPLVAEDRGEDREEHDRQRERGACADTIALEIDPADPKECADHSRSSRPVRAMKTS